MIKRDIQITDSDLEQLCSLFRLLADRTRLSILLRLSEGDRNVTTLCEELNLAQPTVSHHLGLLRMNNIVANHRHGKQVFYGLHRRSDRAPGGVMEFTVQNLLVQVRHRLAGEGGA